MPNKSKKPPSLGACCNCGREDDTVRNIVCVNRRSPEPGFGCWGCLVCGLEQAGAVAVLCEQCLGQVPKMVCVGAAPDNRRIPLDDLTEPFDHDFGKHPEFRDAIIPNQEGQPDFVDIDLDSIDHRRLISVLFVENNPTDETFVDIGKAVCGEQPILLIAAKQQWVPPKLLRIADEVIRLGPTLGDPFPVFHDLIAAAIIRILNKHARKEA
jgi:hypothetical protein